MQNNLEEEREACLYAHAAAHAVRKNDATEGDAVWDEYHLAVEHLNKMCAIRDAEFISLGIHSFAAPYQADAVRDARAAGKTAALDAAQQAVDQAVRERNAVYERTLAF